MSAGRKHRRRTCQFDCELGKEKNRPNQWRIQDLSEGQAQSQDSSVNTTSDVIAKRSLEGEALAFLGGSGGMLPRKILKIEMLRYAFSALFGSIFEPE